MVISLTEIKGINTDGSNIVVRINPVSGYTISFDNTQTTASNPNTSVGNSTDGWTATPYLGDGITLTTNKVILANTEIKVAVKVKAKNVGISTNITARILNGSGGDNNTLNNSSTRAVSIKR